MGRSAKVSLRRTHGKPVTGQELPPLTGRFQTSRLQTPFGQVWSILNSQCLGSGDAPVVDGQQELGTQLERRRRIIMPNPARPVSIRA